jgi:hypothetical protein
MAVFSDLGQESNSLSRKTNTITGVFWPKEKHTGHAIWETRDQLPPSRLTLAIHW